MSSDTENKADQAATQSSVDEAVKAHLERRKALIEADQKQDFSYGLEATLTDDERRANDKLMVWREEVANDHTYNATIHNFFKNKAMLEASKLYRALNVMPKGGLHHIHTSAANPVNAYIQLTYDDKVYWSQHERLFKVYPKHEGVVDGYIQCTKLREFSQDKEEFDQKLRDQILLTPEQADDRESHDIWTFFQHKFTKVGELGKYVPFFEDLLRASLVACIKQNVFVVEYRHISGCLFGDDKEAVDFITELRIIRSIVDELKKTTPHFEVRLILSGLKILGASHVEMILNHVKVGSECKDKNIAELVAGFDLVNEEDFTPEISTFAETILDYQDKVTVVDEPGQKMPTFFHAGETQSRDIKNLEDAIMLGTKRIGHGFQLQLFPHLQELVKQKDICIECCPLSNMVLGYVKDLRQHPVSYLIRRGVQASISSDDPGLFGYEGTTLDYLYAMGSWMLDLRDLKQLSLNGIKYASVSQETKDKLLTEVFEPRWNNWIQQIISESLPENMPV